MLNCKDFVKQQNQRIDGLEPSMMQRMSLKIHALICHHCRRYLKQLRLVDSLSLQLTDTPMDNQIIHSNVQHICQHADKIDQKEN